MITINHLHLTVGDNTTLLKNIHCDIAGNQFVVILGPNGAGKSSLLNVVSGEFKQHNHRITLLGKSLDTWPVKDIAKRVAYLPQANSLNFPFRVEEVVSLGRIPHAAGHEKDEEIVQKVMALLDIAYLKNHIYPQLSGGEKQRVHLARVFAQIWNDGIEPDKPKILLLDEPTSALDIKHQHRLMTLIQEKVSQNVLVLAVMHDFSLAAQYADAIIAMKSGEIVQYGKKENTLNADLIEHVFDVKAEVIQGEKKNAFSIYTSPF